jgi:hypothetical protein
MNHQASNVPHGSSQKGPTDRAYENAKNFASEAADQFKRTASDTVSGLGDHLRQIMDQQVEAGAAMVGTVASSLHTAAGELDQQSPQVGKLTHLAADRLDQAATQLKDKTAKDLLRSVNDFTRRQPALVFGAAALAGFLALRLFKTATVAAPSIQPGQEFRPQARNQFHGV